MTHRLWGLVVAGAVVLGHASAADAQVSLSIRNPVAGNGVVIGNPYATSTYGYAINGYGNPYYAPTYPVAAAYSAPLPAVGVTSYTSGYSSYIAPTTSWYDQSFYPSLPISSSIYPYTAPAYSYPGVGFAPAYGGAPWGVMRGWRW